MLLVQEDQQEPTEFKLFLTASHKLVVGNSKTAELKVGDIPEPPVTETTSKVPFVVSNKQNRTINCLELSADKQYIAVSTENKQLVVFDSTLKVVKNAVLSRVAGKVCFSPQNDILVADRTGDVYLYKIQDELNKPILLLGHLSVISDMLITSCGKYIITSDRDEKIRVSHFPNAYNIATYCLGHTEFVSALKLINKSNILLSASGDGTVRMWEYLQGKQVNLIDTRDLVDKSALDRFASRMDSEKVDVVAMPVVSIDTHEQDNLVTLVVSLFNIDKLFIYNIVLNTLMCSLTNTVSVGAESFHFCLCKRLYVLSTDKFSVFNYTDSDVNTVFYNDIEDKLLEYKGLYSRSTSDVTLWYKRKFDNVQEYLERKKQRLEAK